MARPLNLQRAFTAIAAAATLLLLLTWGGQSLQWARLERGVLEDWRNLPPPTGPRPSHVTPALPGTVGDALALAAAQPHPALPHDWEHGEPLECSSARDRSPFVLNRACAEVVAHQAPWARGMLAASRAADATLTPALEGWRYEVPRDQFPREAPALAVAVVSLDVRNAVALGNADAALTWCADGLAMGRDLALRLGPTGVLFGSHWTVLLTAPCGEALDVATPEAKRSFAHAVETIAATLPSDGAMLRQAVTQRLIEVYGARFDDATLAGLPGPLVALVKARNPLAPRFIWPWERRNELREATALRSTLTAADLGPAAREAAFTVARRRLADTSTRELKVDELFERFDRWRVLLTLLSNAARLDAEDTHAAAPGLTLVDGPDERVLSPATARLARHALRLHRDAGAKGLAPSGPP